MAYIEVECGFKIDGFFSPLEYFWDEKFVFNGESHSAWEIVFVLDGEIEVTEDENVYLLKKNDMIFHASGEFHRIKSSGGTHPHVFIMAFEVSGDMPLALKDGVFRLRDGEAAEYTECFRRLQSLRGGSREDYLAEEVVSRLYLFFIRLSKRGIDTAHSVFSTALEYKRLVSAMSEGTDKNLTLEDFSRENCISVSYIKYLFSKHAGVSPKRYYITLRVRRAEELLRSGATAKEIVAIMNFSSSAYFSAFLKRETGKSPTELLS